jgi:hypothetical protein
MDAFCAKSYLSRLKLEPIFCFMLPNKSMLHPVPYLPVSLPILVRQLSQGMLNTHPHIYFTAGSNHLSNFYNRAHIAFIRYESLEGLISLTPFSTSQSHSRKVLLPPLQLLSFAHSHPTTIITSSLT